MRPSRPLISLALYLALAATLCAACADKKPSEGEKKPSKAAPETLIGATPQLPDELAKATWGSPQDAVLAALGWDDDRVDSKTHSGVKYTLRFDDERGLEQLRAELSDPEGAVAAAVAQWGEGQAVEALGGGTLTRHFNPDKELLASVEVTKDYEGKPVVEITYERYVPVDKVLGLTDKVSLPPALSKLQFGMSANDAAAAVGLDDSIHQSPDNPDVSYSYYVPTSENRLKSVRIMVEHADLRTLLTEKWGEPNVGQDVSANELLLWLDPDAGIRAMYQKETAGTVREELELTAYVPLAKLVGTEKGKLGLEAPMLGATWDEIAAAYKDYVSDKYVYYLPTDYADSSFTSFSFAFDDATGKATQVNFSAGFSAFPGVKDELLGVFKAVYGEPREGKDYINRPVLEFNDTPKVSVRYDDIMKAWDVTYATP